MDHVMYFLVLLPLIARQFMPERWTEARRGMVIIWVCWVTFMCVDSRRDHYAAAQQRVDLLFLHAEGRGIDLAEWKTRLDSEGEDTRWISDYLERRP